MQELQQLAGQQQQQQQWNLPEVAMDTAEWGRFQAAAAPLAAIVDAAAGRSATDIAGNSARGAQKTASVTHKRTGEQQQQPPPKKPARVSGGALRLQGWLPLLLACLHNSCDCIGSVAAGSQLWPLLSKHLTGDNMLHSTVRDLAFVPLTTVTLVP
jgi:hypothetical protein